MILQQLRGHDTQFCELGSCPAILWKRAKWPRSGFPGGAGTGYGGGYGAVHLLLEYKRQQRAFRRAGSNGLGGGQFHGFGDGPRISVQSPADDPREGKRVIDGAAIGGYPGAGGEGLSREDFRLRIGESEDNAGLRH